MRYNGFFDIHQMRSYLRRSVIRVDDIPAYVDEIEEGINKAGKRVYKILYTRLERRINRKVNIKSKRVNLLPVPLGFCNYGLVEKDNCFIASRVPSRMWKIGLSSNNLQIRPVAGKLKVGISNLDLIRSVSLSDTILGNFPSYKNSREKALWKGPFHTVAFHRHFAVQHRHHIKKRLSLIYYKFNVPVGFCDDDGAKLKPDYMFLQEHLNEV
jgi:hypothetical protein